MDNEIGSSMHGDFLVQYNTHCQTTSVLLLQTVPVSEDALPVVLPQDIQFTGRGPSPLTLAKDWQRASCGTYVELLWL